MSKFEEIIKDLPLDLQEEVKNFAEFLKNKKEKQQSGTLKLEWRGALRDLRDKYNSVELQHKVLEWWGD